MTLIGYARVSTQDQNLSAQLEALNNAGVNTDNIYHGKQSGKSDTNQLMLDAMVEKSVKGDTVIITRLDRLGRSLNVILNTLQKLSDKEVAVRSLDGQVDTSSSDPMKKAMTQLLGVFAELEHSIIVDRLQTGRTRTGKLGGRKELFNESQKEVIKTKYNESVSISALAREFKTSRATIGKIVK